jgi:hypothetical protein
MTIVACVLSVMINGEAVLTYITGKLVKDTGSFYIVDFSGGAADMPDEVKSNMKNYSVSKDDCVTRKYEGKK